MYFSVEPKLLQLGLGGGRDQGPRKGGREGRGKEEEKDRDQRPRKEG